MKFNCGLCNYSSNDKFNFSKHKKACDIKQNMIIQTNKLKTQLIQKDEEFAKELAYKDKLIAIEIARREDIVKSKDEIILILTTEIKNLKIILNSIGMFAGNQCPYYD